jgi:hypothetical protein
MLHADVIPQPWWLDTLIAEAEKHDADLLSAVIPLKDFSGNTSTAIRAPSNELRPFCRLTLNQVNHPRFPETFDIHAAAEALEQLPAPLGIRDVPREALWVNTGCFVCRVNQPWCEKVWFSIEDRIKFIDGLWRADFMPEDWMFSQRVADQGCKVMATKILSVVHRGISDFPSNGTWGQPRDAGLLPFSAEN